MIYNKPSKSDTVMWWFFVVFISLFLIYIMLIHPLMVPTDQMPFANVFGTGKDAKKQYAIWTGGAMVAGLLGAVILIKWTEHSQKPFSSLLHDITQASHDDRISHSQYMSLIQSLPPFGHSRIPEVRLRLERYLNEQPKGKITATK